MAIAGLERRLLRSFGAQGGLGAFHSPRAPGQLRRSLLWGRARDVAALRRIEFGGGRGGAAGRPPPPTWSWMGYEGGIEYLDLPFGRVGWEEGDIHPVGAWGSDTGSDAAGLGLSVVARGFGDDGTLGGSVALDDPGRTGGLMPGLKCVVLGRLSAPRPGPERPVGVRTHFVLLVTAWDALEARGGSVYHRVGVGSVPGSWIQLEGPVTVGTIL